jgi:hypothetical protein
MAKFKGHKWKLKLKFFEIKEKQSDPDEITSLACEVTLPNGKELRAAVAFLTKPTSAHLSEAADELKRWGQFQLEKWDKTRTEYINDIIN